MRKELPLEDDDEDDGDHVPIRLVVGVLDDSKLNALISSVNGRPTPVNVALIKACIWLTYKHFMQPYEIHEVLVAYETQCKS